MRCTMGFLLAGIPMFTPLVVPASALDNAVDTDCAFSNITSHSACDGSDSFFDDGGLSCNYRLA